LFWFFLSLLSWVRVFGGWVFFFPFGFFFFGGTIVFGAPFFLQGIFPPGAIPSRAGFAAQSWFFLEGPGWRIFWRGGGRSLLGAHALHSRKASLPLQRILQPLLKDPPRWCVPGLAAFHPVFPARHILSSGRDLASFHCILECPFPGVQGVPAKADPSDADLACLFSPGRPFFPAGLFFSLVAGLKSLSPPHPFPPALAGALRGLAPRFYACSWETSLPGGPFFP